ncbi:GAF domain-containing protein [Bradyrhizobium viridifuturi]|nr:GAF domain-containing protein [Bradyrhizobium viridifuturi]ERF83833.1 MAG: spermidine/putrescine transport system substrate-binding protein [Bradyrhizobium sp. DFCI-1]MCA3796765.1 GAF domain-containing protein [Burkholderia sp.]OYU63384.1 MAG: histidine kinase [Bradyrhizobium sp. PARBB1]QRI71357.1 GAF domain-containing protein [Bradyrhizobium sp. PSBB068]HAQ83649.1 PAS domain-containing protein [Bradyrhizobium sp.]
MALHSLATPAFGKADLSNCEREEIHLAGSIQPHGALLVVSEPDHRVIQASANAAEFLNLKQVDGMALADLDGDLLVRILPHLDPTAQGMPIAVRCRIGSPGADYDGLLHRPPEGGLVIELERAGPSVDLTRYIAKALEKIRTASSIRALCEEAATLFQDRTGYDRVMVYRFDDEGHGEVFSERRKPELEAYLGNRYPATDIPQMARRLYERTRVRVLVDVNYQPVPLQPRFSPITGRDLDMSLCFLRSMSPIHLQYLKNMGVGATLVISLVVGGKLWGLVACHHYEPRFIHFELRAVCELLAEAIATRIAALESFAQSQSELFVQRLEQRMIEAMSREGDWRGAIFDSSQSILQPLGASGGALIYEGQIISTGEVPGTQEIREIGAWLDTHRDRTVVATASLGLDLPQFAGITKVASGVAVTPISSNPGEYLIWFRPERIRTVTWGGDPLKPFVIGNSPTDLSPRRSFAQWHQQVEGTSDPWTPADLAAARLIGQSVADIVLQFRAVRTLIAQDQLEQFSRQVRVSEQPVIIADIDGKILLVNEAFKTLLPKDHSAFGRLDELAGAFQQPDRFLRDVAELIRHHRPWRGELLLRSESNREKPLLIRADPVHPSRDRVLGFVLIFSDITDRKAAEIARSRFQEGIVQSNRISSVRLDSKTDLVYQNLLSSVIENAQLAALEITYGVETGRIAEMLESVRNSTLRTAEVLEHLIWHASRTSGGGKPNA